MEQVAAFITRKEIIKTGRTLFRTKGFDNTSVQDVLDILNISEQVFLRFFCSLDDLLEVVWSE